MSSISIILALSLLWQNQVWSVPKDRFYYEARGEVVWEVKTDEKVVALTFDDGPHPNYTAEILDLLKQYEAQATFFVVGNKAKQLPELVYREFMEGHEIANHTFSHPYLRKKTNMKKEIYDAEIVIDSITGRKCALFRPPGGMYNQQLVNLVNQEGYKMVLWSWHLDTRDWDTPGVQSIVNRVLKNIKSGNIVLFHDYVEGRTQTIDALKIILPELKSRGYRFVTVSDLLSYQKLAPAKK